MAKQPPKKLAPFPHEYAKEAESLLRRLDYVMRDYMLTMIGVAENMNREHVTTPRAVLLLAVQGKCERLAAEVKEMLDSEIEVNGLMKELGFPENG